MRTIKIDMSSKKDYLLRINESIASSRYIFSFPTQKLLFFLLSKYEGEKIELPLKKVYDVIELKTYKKNIEILKSCITEINLNSIKISEIHSTGKEHWKIYSWIVLSNIDEEKDILYLEFNPEIKEVLFSLKEYIHKKNIEISNEKHHPLLIMLKEFKENILEIEVNELKKILGLSKNYKILADLNKRVIYPALKKLNEETNAIIFPKPIRNSRFIESIEFIKLEKSNLQGISETIKKDLLELISKENININLFHFSEQNLGYDENILQVVIDHQSIIQLHDFFTKSIKFTKYQKNMQAKGIKIFYS